MTPILHHKEGAKTLLSLYPLYEPIEGMEDHLNNPTLMKYSEQRHRGHTPRSMIGYVRSFDHYNDHLWRIQAPVTEDRCSNVGTVTAYRDRPNGVANVGILVWIGKRGYGTMAWELVCDWLLSDGIRKIEAGTMETNTAMLKVFERSDMEVEAVIKDHFIFEGRPVNLILAARYK